VKYKSSDFSGLVKAAEYQQYQRYQQHLEKSAAFEYTGWGQRNPGAALAADIGLSFIPGVGTALSAVDAYNSF
jgi:hypothetical protein